MGYITELKSKTKGTRYKAVINIRKPSEGIEYFDTETFSTRALAKAWLKREEDRLEKNPHLLSTDKDAVASAAMSLASAFPMAPKMAMPTVRHCFAPPFRSHISDVFSDCPSMITTGHPKACRLLKLQTGGREHPPERMERMRHRPSRGSRRPTPANPSRPLSPHIRERWYLRANPPLSSAS